MKCRIDLVVPCAMRTGHNVEIVEIKSGSRRDDMIPLGDQDKISIMYCDRFIEILAIHTLEGEPVARRDAMIIRLLKVSFVRRVLGIMFVRRERGPVASRSNDLDDDQALRCLVGIQDVLDAALRSAFTA